MPCTSALSMRAGHLDHRVSGEVWPRVAPRRKFGIRRCCCDWLEVGPGLAAPVQAAHVLAEKEQDLGCMENYRREQGKMCIGADTRMSLARCRRRPVIPASSTQPSSILKNEGKTVEPHPPWRNHVYATRLILTTLFSDRVWAYDKLPEISTASPYHVLLSLLIHG
jgi:hypothetical protein